MSKFKGKTGISKGVKAKKWKNPGWVMIKMTGNRGGQLQKNRYPQHGGTIFFWKSPMYACGYSENLLNGVRYFIEKKKNNHNTVLKVTGFNSFSLR